MAVTGYSVIAQGRSGSDQSCTATAQGHLFIAQGAVKRAGLKVEMKIEKVKIEDSGVNIERRELLVPSIVHSQESCWYFRAAQFAQG